MSSFSVEKDSEYEIPCEKYCVVEKTTLEERVRGEAFSSHGSFYRKKFHVYLLQLSNDGYWEPK